MGHLAQTMHLTCTDTNNVSKWTETRFHMTHVTKEFHCVRPKRYSILWNVRCKPCNYLASRLQYLQMDQNELPLDPRHLEVPLGSSKPIFVPMVCLVQTLHLSCVKITLSSNWLKRASTWASSPSSTIGCIQNDLCAYGTFGANRAPILCQDYTISKWTEMSFHLTHVN